MDWYTCVASATDTVLKKLFEENYQMLKPINHWTKPLEETFCGLDLSLFGQNFKVKSVLAKRFQVGSLANDYDLDLDITF